MKSDTERPLFSAAPRICRLGAVLLACALLWSCGMMTTQRQTSRTAQPAQTLAQQGTAGTEPSPAAGVPDNEWTERVVTEDEIARVCDRDPSLTFNDCREILARLNVRATCDIAEAIRSGQPIKAPNDFTAFRDWTPLPPYTPVAEAHPKLIVVAKDVYFLGWYERGKLVGDAQACIGKSGEETRNGFFTVKEKDDDHVSRSYKNDFGRPALMPWALRIYGTVWIHAGYVSSETCSHGCVILPPEPAEALFRWADPGTPVLIVDSLASLEKEAKNLTTQYGQAALRASPLR